MPQSQSDPRFSPAISVLMPALNAERYISDAIQSILHQSFGDFELIIFNDGSTDRTGEIIEQFNDCRIVLFNSQENTGLVNVRNHLVSMARGKYIAFLDADDVAAPDRLQIQKTYLDANLADICGGAYFALYEANGKIKSSKQRYTDSDIRALLTISSPLCNPAVMGKAEVFKKFAYRVGKNYAEDYSLWVEMALAGYRFINLSDRLITYRIHTAQTSQSQNLEVSEIFSKSREEYLIGLGISPLIIPSAMSFIDRLRLAISFLLQLNQKISGISIGANYEIYARFQYRGNGLFTPLIRLERLLVSTLASIRGNLNSIPVFWK